LAQIVAAAGYTEHITTVAERIVEAKDQATVHALLTEGVRALGADNAVFVSFIRDNADLSACRFMLVCEPDWCRRYLDAGCFAHDPWLAYAAHHSEPIAASSLPVLDAEGQRVIALAQQNGFASAALVPAHSGAGHSRISLLCLGSTRPGFFDGEGFGRFRLGARLIAAELHDWWLARIRRELIVRARITQADLELLRHEHQGHSSKRIAAELHVSKSSINSRFQRMNMKLGVPNRRLAARLAVECGLLIG
jgi:DNA-binding CsgD family transcriptional regulator